MSMWKTILGNKFIISTKKYLQHLYDTSHFTVKVRKPWTPEKFQECWLCTGQFTAKFRTCKQTTKPETNYCCCLRFSFLAPHKYFWCSQFCEFHSKWKSFSLYTYLHTGSHALLTWNVIGVISFPMVNHDNNFVCDMIL